MITIFSVSLNWPISGADHMLGRVCLEVLQHMGCCTRQLMDSAEVPLMQV